MIFDILLYIIGFFIWFFGFMISPLNNMIPSVVMTTMESFLQASFLFANVFPIDRFLYVIFTILTIEGLLVFYRVITNIIALIRGAGYGNHV